jgi:hypothetical protein
VAFEERKITILRRLGRFPVNFRRKDHVIEEPLYEIVEEEPYFRIVNFDIEWMVRVGATEKIVQNLDGHHTAPGAHMPCLVILIPAQCLLVDVVR